MSETVGVKYIGTALPTGSTTVNVFSSVVSFPAGNMLQALGINRIYMTFQNSQSGTLKLYRSTDRGSNWTQFGSVSVSAASANAENPVDVDVEPYYGDVKIDWVNGGSDQATFSPQVSLVNSRNQAF